jgi:hypothetical protein
VFKMADMNQLQGDLRRLEKAIQSVQATINELELLPTNTQPGSEGGRFLMRRQEVLAHLGIERKVGRASWSHDNGESIIFDAWEDHWIRDERTGVLLEYPMRTNRDYNLAKSIREKNRGHTRWQYHVDLVLNGQRQAIAIVPVRTDADEPNRRTRGWLPQYVNGTISEQSPDEYWFQARNIVPL